MQSIPSCLVHCWSGKVSDQPVVSPRWGDEVGPLILMCLPPPPHWLQIEYQIFDISLLL